MLWRLHRRLSEISTPAAESKWKAPAAYGSCPVPKSSDLSRNPDYYSARAVEERRLAMAAKDPQVRAIHLQMAKKYAELALHGEPAGPQQPMEDEQQTG
jgi:hypothetical protein